MCCSVCMTPQGQRRFSRVIRAHLPGSLELGNNNTFQPLALLYLCVTISSKHEALYQCCFNAGVGQNEDNIDSTSRVCLAEAATLVGGPFISMEMTLLACHSIPFPRRCGRWRPHNNSHCRVSQRVSHWKSAGEPAEVSATSQKHLEETLIISDQWADA